jgi:hypothetical protein
MLLGFCALLSTAAALLVVSRFSLPKAISMGQLRYVELPPTLKDVYQPPGMLEFTEILKSNEIMTQLAHRTGQDVSTKELRRRFRLQASRYSNIIDIELRGRDPKQTIDLVNELMRIACETIASNRKHTLTQYAREAEVQYAVANQRVLDLHTKLTKLRQKEIQLSPEGTMSSTVQLIINKTERVKEQLDSLAMNRTASERQRAALEKEAQVLRDQIKMELVKGCRSQIESMKKLWNPRSEKYRPLVEASRALDVFERDDSGLEYQAWRAKLDAIVGTPTLAPDAATMAVVTSLERELFAADAKIKQIDFETLGLDSNQLTLQGRLDEYHRELAAAMGITDDSTIELEETQAQLTAATATRSRYADHLNDIRRGQETDFEEMTVLTPASPQTTEANDGKTKLFVFTLAGCFAVLVMPVFALEHFYPSGDPASRAAQALGIPCVSRGTFVTQRLKHDRLQLHSFNSEAMRLLALRIQQSVHGPGSMVLFSGLNHEKSSIPMISYLAECLARREERVLIIDACDRPHDSSNRSANDDSVNAVLSPSHAETAASSVPESDRPTNGNARSTSADAALPVNVRDKVQPGVLGLSDYLHRRDLRPEAMICATSIPGVDIIPCGTAAFPREGLASSSLTALFDECRQRYTMILVAGPSTDHPSDLQMLSARADGILFTIPQNGRPAGRGEDVVRDLLELGAPVIGIVS